MKGRVIRRAKRRGVTQDSGQAPPAVFKGFTGLRVLIFLYPPLFDFKIEFEHCIQYLEAHVLSNCNPQTNISV